MNKRIEEELFPFYALDALTDEEKAEVEAYIATDPAARERLNSLQETAEMLPLSAESVMPSPSVKANLMERVQGDSRAQTPQVAPIVAQKRPTERPSPPQISWWDRLRRSIAMPALAGTAALAAIILFIWAISLNQQITDLQEQVADLSSDTALLTDDLETLRDDNDQLRVRNETLQQQLESQNDILASYQAPGTNTIAIGDITGEHPQAHATLTVAADSANATFIAENLPRLGAEQVYQLWIIHDNQPFSAGIFNVDEDGRIVHQIDGALAASFDAVGVSIEPAGGSEQPTQDQIILLGAASS
jgi:anti-sigma-K factor RskA